MIWDWTRGIIDPTAGGGGGGGVTSFNARTGAVVPESEDYRSLLVARFPVAAADVSFVPTGCVEVTGLKPRFVVQQTGIGRIVVPPDNASNIFKFDINATGQKVVSVSFAAPAGDFPANNFGGKGTVSFSPLLGSGSSVSGNDIFVPVTGSIFGGVYNIQCFWPFSTTALAIGSYRLNMGTVFFA